MCCWSLKAVKCAVVLLTIFYFITGIILFITGIVIAASGTYAELLPGVAYLNTAYLLIFIGIVIFVSAVIGCCCLRDTKCCVLTFYFLVVIVICLEVSVIILGYVANGVLRDRIDDYINQEMLRDMRNYGTDQSLKEAWDKVQREESCCGVRTASDWFNPLYGKRSFLQNEMPDSCCEIVQQDCGLKEEYTKHSKGCEDVILDDLHKNLRSLATITLICLLVQVVLVLFILCLYYMLFTNKAVHWCCSCCVYEMVEIEDDDKHKFKTDSV
ncbi:tetraspanin-9-like [Antedon mediterranea]|uniref:tetraspanin-9-like n=1 Tax=Antedon mediterranea TaxID=105859 RepID=UPI003AF46F32